jgi:gluconokinase
MHAGSPYQGWVIIGPSGAGKTAIAAALAARLDAPFIEADDLHPRANVAKMASGQPLDDGDRGPWLSAVAAAIAAELRHRPQVVVACSALKRRYREKLIEESGARLVFVHPQVDRRTLEHRLAHRGGHFMPPSLLDSQLEAFEPPQADEASIALPADRDLEALVSLCLQAASGTPSTCTR